MSVKKRFRESPRAAPEVCILERQVRLTRLRDWLESLAASEVHKLWDESRQFGQRANSGRIRKSQFGLPLLKLKGCIVDLHWFIKSATIRNPVPALGAKSSPEGLWLRRAVIEERRLI